MKKLFSYLIVLLLISSTGLAQGKSMASIQKNDLKAYMSFFASDEMEGRETGTHANSVSALYIKTNLLRLGLKPIPQTGDYFQMMPMRSTYLDPKGTYIIIKNMSDSVFYTNDSVIYLIPPSESLNVTGDVVFVGYGFADTISGYNDFSGINMNDKIVLCMTGNPQLAAQDVSSPIFSDVIETSKLELIIGENPKAILYVYNPISKYQSAYHSGLADMISGGKPGSNYISLKDQTSISAPLPIVFITRYSADMLLKSTGNNLEQLENKILARRNPVSVKLGDITVAVSANIEISEFQSPNVIGIVEGSDPVLKNECVVYTAHFDHAGMNSKGGVLNGADDNASGSMGLLEIAEAFMTLKKKPLRTIVFAWVNAEEKGLLGSQYYTDNPIFPLENTLVNINLDMIGRSVLPSDTIDFMGYELDVTQADEILVYTAHESTELTNMLNNSAKEIGIQVIDMGEKLRFGSSDHASFMAKGIPAFLFHSGIHSDLHSEKDDVDRIDFDKMAKVSKLAFLLGYKVASQRDRIKLDGQE